MRYAMFDEAGRVALAVNDATIEALPEGAHELDEEQFANRFTLRLIDGVVTVTAPPAPPLADVRARLLADLRARRDRALNVLDGLQVDAMTDGNVATAGAIRMAKAACRDLPALDVSAATDEDGIRALYLAEWRRIAGTVPEGVRTAFAAVLA